MISSRERWSMPFQGKYMFCMYDYLKQNKATKRDVQEFVDGSTKKYCRSPSMILRTTLRVVMIQNTNNSEKALRSSR